jgi:hypothetical protein
VLDLPDGGVVSGRSLALARSRSSASVSGQAKVRVEGASAPPWQSYYSTDANDLHALSVVLRRPIRRMEIALRQCVLGHFAGGRYLAGQSRVNR